jgi:hypothetical protein
MSRAILCPHFTALISREVMRVQTSMQIVSFLVHVIVDEVLNKKLGNYTPIDNILTHYAAEYHTPGTPQESRVALCTKMGLLTTKRLHFLPLIESIREF